MNRTLILIALFASFAPVHAPAEMDDCQNLHSAVQIAVIQRDNLVKKRAELEDQFKRMLERDIDAQADGIFDNLHRNSAKKVFFAKKQLSTAIEKKDQNIQAMADHYCKICPTAAENKSEYCRTCPQSKSCEAQDL